MFSSGQIEQFTYSDPSDGESLTMVSNKKDGRKDDDFPAEAPDDVATPNLLSKTFV